MFNENHIDLKLSPIDEIVMSENDIDSKHRHISLNVNTIEQDEGKESYFFMIPYSDAFEFANITDDISKMLKKNKIDPFIHTEKVKIHKHKLLGISPIFKYGIVIHAYKRYTSVLDFYFKNKREYTVITEDAMNHKHITPIICERDHSMNDLIRKK